MLLGISHSSRSVDMSRVCLLALAALLACARNNEGSERSSAEIAEGEHAVTTVTGELGDPLHVRCLESEEPKLHAFWYRGHGTARNLLHDDGSVYEMRRNLLLIKSLAFETLGQYTCQANTSHGMEAPRIINVRACKPDGLYSNNKWLVPCNTTALSMKTISTSTSIPIGAPGQLATDKLAKEVAAPEGGIAMLRCLSESTTLHDGSRPSVTWKHGELKIDGNAGRYRLTSDGALEIVSLYRNDTGVYICVADNGLGQARQEIHLVVNDPVLLPAGVVGDEDAVVTGTLGQPLHVRCLAYGYPHPVVGWYHDYGGDMALHNDPIYEVTENILLIKSLSMETLGQYTCQAFNGIGRVSWRVVVEIEWSGPGFTMPPRPSRLPSITTNIGPFSGGECQNSPHGCCPDNVTVALGPDNLGCGCQYTQHGCCPDRHTAAFGPNNKGCACNTHQFGCCPDGVTIAKGPDQQGCHCPVSMFGCCGDGETPATGPDATGCDCSSSRHGCCPDGQTEAAGPKFLGCTDALENKQAACSMPTDSGSCKNFTRVWYYDMAYGGCFTFWYGGCDGNGNRFPTKEECVDVCVQPSPKDACKLPSVKGACDADYQRWHYNSTREQCIPFSYGGCLGNANNFDSRELCQKQCEPSSVTETSIKAALSETTTAITESSESRKGSTANEATTDVISTTTMDPCSGFAFGCCADNDTEVFGPDGQGCPCNTTEFGCCPDGTSPASGLNNEGCPGSCSTTPHGCCQDGKTPAHGPKFEGCCLLQAFGCCPDNRKPAEGPHLEGCGCQNAQHGCCPDNVTVALGPDNLGCGCQYMQHGCCPDRVTVASGPNNKGCACNTHQFGCCPDGVTIAKGPDQQGCDCRDSKFGCCGDGETSATGLDAAGCDCSSSRHGCCPDGQTEAAGPKFLGCTDAPENKQAACSMPTDRGSCKNFFPMWYYDLGYGGCSRFWYGGCDGNGNRFATKEECVDVCVQPSPKDACKLPSVKGPCDADYQRWHYNSTLEQCVPFRYGGCLGNANNFESRELCQKQCEPSSVTGQCDLPIDPGSCAGTYSRWGFNSEVHRCEQFIWGGCEGNSNRFSSKAACQMRCAGTQPSQCTQRPETGNCTEREALWSFSQSENRCLPFYYSGCGGNDNRFGSREACEQTCPSAYVPDKCTLPFKHGECENYRERWFYDTTYKICRQFYYGGCGGNENNFVTKAECDSSCSEVKSTTTTTTATARPTEPKQQTLRPDEREPRPSGPGRSDPCSLPPKGGNCLSYIQQWYYDSSRDQCHQFVYTGCSGNDNRFETQSDCETRCKRPRSTTTTVVTPPQQEAEAECKTPSSLALCGNNVTVFYYDSERRECLVSAIGGCGHPNTYGSEEECERSCGAFRGTDVCGAQLDPGPCRAAIPKIYWDTTTGSCQQFAYGGCVGGPNRFSSVEECMNVCGDSGPERACLQAADPGQLCDAVRAHRWHYSVAHADCVAFVYLGCGGNDNNFQSYDHCADACSVPKVNDVPAAPQALPQQVPPVEASEGGAATLRCVFHGNPPPKITWRFGELTIDGNAGRYRLMSDGALEIVSLYRNDTGVYICVADNGLGQARQEIHLVVNDPVRMPVGIAGDENATKTGELGQPLHVRCLAYGYPPPSVFWYHGDGLVLYNDAVYEARKNVLLIKSLAIETLGAYTCQAYNGEGMPASWVVLVRAYKPEGLFMESELLVSRNSLAPRPKTQAPTTAETTTTTTTTTTEAPRPLFTVPVSTHVSSPSSTLNIGAELHLTCEVDGFPEPDVYWTKDGVSIQPDGRITITGSTIESRLTVTRVTVADSGLYACHASNAYSSQSDTAQINVQQLMVPAKCTDNPAFANCDLIVSKKFCRHTYYSKFCCKSCVEAGQLDPVEVRLQADQLLKKK